MWKKVYLVILILFAMTCIAASEAGAADTSITLQMEIHINPEPLLVPVAGEQNQASITVFLQNCVIEAGSEKCMRLPDARIEIELLNHDLFSFINTERVQGTTDEKGMLISSLRIRAPEKNDLKLHELWERVKAESKKSGNSANPLSLNIQVKGYLKNENAPRIIKVVNIPFDLIFIKGVTVGPGMQPRNDKTIPIIYERNSGQEAQVASSMHPTRTGEFYVLFRRSTAGIWETKNQTAYMHNLILQWNDSEYLSLKLPLSLLQALNKLPAEMRAGDLIDIGVIDMLKPAEHENRITTWIKEFLATMQYDNGNLNKTLNNLQSLQFRYNAKGTSIPHYAVSNPESIGEIQIPVSKESFWATPSLAGKNQNPPYLLVLHEFGHFVHKQMVDRWLAPVAENKNNQDTAHSVWNLPEAQTETGKFQTE